MARKAQNGEISKSQAIRDLIAANPSIKASQAVVELKSKGISITPGLFYVTKGKSIGSRKRRRKAVAVETTTTAPKAKGHDAVAVIGKVKFVASEVGGMKALAAIIDALIQ